MYKFYVKVFLSSFDIFYYLDIYQKVKDLLLIFCLIIIVVVIKNFKEVM